MSTAVRIPNKLMVDLVEDLVSETNDPGGHYTKVKIIRLTASATDDLNLTLIPNFVTIDGIISEAGSFDMPEDCIRPVIATWIKECETGDPICFPLGIRDKHQSVESLICVQEPEAPEPVDCTPIVFYNYYGRNQEFYVYSHWYFENYGEGQERFFGWITYSVENNRIEFTGGPQAGEKILITYRSDNSQAKVIPLDAVPMVRNMVLHRHWLPSNHAVAAEYWRQFKIAINQFKKSRLSGYSLEDYIDAFTREYRSSLSP